jgi:hypothetical protein
LKDDKLVVRGALKLLADADFELFEAIDSTVLSSRASQAEEAAGRGDEKAAIELEAKKTRSRDANRRACNRPDRRIRGRPSSEPKQRSRNRRRRRYRRTWLR